MIDIDYLEPLTKQQIKEHQTSIKKTYNVHSPFTPLKALPLAGYDGSTGKVARRIEEFLVDPSPEEEDSQSNSPPQKMLVPEIVIEDTSSEKQDIIIDGQVYLPEI